MGAPRAAAPLSALPPVSPNYKGRGGGRRKSCFLPLLVTVLLGGRGRAEREFDLVLRVGFGLFFIPLSHVPG